MVNGETQKHQKDRIRLKRSNIGLINFHVVVVVAVVIFIVLVVISIVVVVVADPEV